jgi:hypothetical protein
MIYQLANETELGETEAAAATLAEFERRFPNLTVEALGFGASFIRPRELDKLVETMVNAGAPLCVPPDKADALPRPKHLAVCDAARAKQASR